MNSNLTVKYIRQYSHQYHFFSMNIIYTIKKWKILRKTNDDTLDDKPSTRREK